MENLLKFPQSSFVDKLIPKSMFVKASNTPTAVRDFLTEQFEQIRLLYVLRADTLNVDPGDEVKEIDVFYFRTKQDSYSINQFCALDNLIPRQTLYIIEHGGRFDLLMQLKRRSVVAGMPKWTHEVTQIQKNVNLNDINLRIEGINLDRLYYNLLSQLSGYQVDDSESLMKIKALEDEITKKRRQAESLQKQIRKERQFNIQVELNTQARGIKREIAELTQRLNELKNKQL